MKLDRRTLLVGGGAGIGLVVAWAWFGGSGSALDPRGQSERFGNFIRIGRDGRVTVAVPQVETGQGSWTALPQIVANELGAAWDTVAVEPAPLLPAYGNPLAAEQGWLGGFGPLRRWRMARDGANRITAGATSVRAFEQPLREGAAAARAMLVDEAADRWGVEASQCTTADGFVMHGARRLGFGEIAEEAAGRRLPRSAQLRGEDAGRLLGRDLPRLDALAKADGSWRFAGDVRLPNLLHASARIAPPGGRLSEYDRSVLSESLGVRHVAARDGWIAVAADSWWQAERALQAANARFTAHRLDGGPRAMFDRALEGGQFETLFERGDYSGAVEGSRPLAATYYVAPSQHLAIEPLSATARTSGGATELWSGTRAPGLASAGAGAFYPMPCGEPAGRTFDNPAAPIALHLASETGRPVQVTIPQSACQSGDPLSPGALVRMAAINGANGVTAALRMDMVGANGMAASLARMAGVDPPETFSDGSSAGWVPTYAIPDLEVRGSAPSSPWRSGYMRASPEREAAFAVESFIDELAHAAGTDPLSLRMALLGGNLRLARCFQAASRRAGWDGGRPGSTMGIAGASAFGSHIALVASAALDPERGVRVERLTCALDCGRHINPGLVRQQVEGALIWAIGQAVVAAPEWRGTLPVPRRFADIGLPAMAGLPAIDLVLLPSAEPPGGVNGIGAIPLAPALANAIFAGTGKRMRALPFDPMASA